MWSLIKHFENRIITEVVRNFDTPLLFGLGGQQERIRPPEAYGLQGFEAIKVPSHDDHQTPIGIWYKPPADDTKPTYIAFHGRGGHWATQSKSMPAEGDLDGRRRLQWLKEMADSGAGVIAMHTRGFGLSNPEFDASRRGERVIINENTLKKDMRAVAGFLEERKIRPEQTIVTGESLGGALAAMMAETMEETMHKPPAVLGLVNSFASMGDAAHDLINGGIINKSIEAYHEERAKAGWYFGKFARPVTQRLNIGEYISEYKDELARVTRARRIELNTEKRLGDMDLTDTHVYIANSPDDTTVSFGNAQRLRQSAAREGGSELVTFTKLEGDYIQSDCNDPHLNWNPQKIVADMGGLFAQRQQQVQLSGRQHQ